MVVAETISSSESDDEDNNGTSNKILFPSLMYVIIDNDEPPSSHKSRHRDENVKKKAESSRNSSEHNNANNKEEKNHHSGGREHNHRKHNADGHSSSDNKARSSSDKHHRKERQHREQHKSTTATQSSEINGKNGIIDGDDEENRLIIDIKSEEIKDVRDSKHHRSDRKDDKRTTNSGYEHRSDKHKSSRNSEKSQHKSIEKADRHRSGSDKNSERSSHHHRKGEEKPGDRSSTPTKRKRESDDGSPSKQSLNNQANSSKAKKPKTETTSTVDEIDSSMGTSFAEALGMMMPKLSKQKGSLKNLTSDVIKVSSNDTAKVPDKVKTKVSPTTSRSEQKAKESPTQPPKLLSSSFKLPPLEPVIAVDFPIISNNYKPLPLNPTVMECVFNNYNQTQQPKKMMTDEEAFGSGISSKSMR